MQKDIYYVVAHREQAEIDSFKTRYKEFDTGLIDEILDKSLGVKVKRFKRSKSWGSSHVIYFVEVKGHDESLVLRANLGFNKEAEVVMLVEKLVTDGAAKLGVPVNKVLYVDVLRKHFDFDFQIQEKLEGNDLEDHFKGTKSEYDQMSFDLGVMMAKYHQLTFDGFGMFDHKSALRGVLRGSKRKFIDYMKVCLESDIEYLVEAQVVSKSVGKKIGKLFDKYKKAMDIKRGVLVHHDLADHNIFFKNNKITGIFDWEACVSADPMLDLVSCPTWGTHYPRAQKLIEGYKTVSHLPDDFEEKRKIYLFRTLLWKTVYAIRMNILTDKRKQRFTDVLKLFKFI